MLIGFSGDDSETLSCPPGYSVGAGRVNGVDQTWCQDAQGNQLPINSPAPVEDSSGFGVLGWSIAAATGLLFLSVMFGRGSK